MTIELDTGCGHLIFPYGDLAVLSVDAYLKMATDRG
jgi:hypothetical protein